MSVTHGSDSKTVLQSPSRALKSQRAQDRGLEGRKRNKREMELMYAPGCFQDPQVYGISFAKKGITVAHSVEEVLKLVEDRPGNEIFVCGGEGTYRALLPHCDVAHVLFVEMEYDANHYMENLDKSEEWELVEESDEQTYFDMTYYFRKYVRVR